jgi:5-formyltetrahydrofolate cyclo-ligase
MNFSTVRVQKSCLRRQICVQKNRYSAEELRQMSVFVLQNLESLPGFVEAETLLLYWSLSDEVFTHDFIEKWCGQKNIFLPVVENDNLIFRKYQGKDSLQKGTFDIFEPAAESECFAAKSKTIVLVPGVAFDRQGNRLGRGKGFYDRFLKSFCGLKIGICFDFQLLDNIPTEPFDVKMDRVVF